MASKSLDSEKFKEAIKYIDVKCFGSSNVVSQISSGFISDLTRLEFLKLAFEKTKSNENYIESGSQFKSQEYKKEFENFTKQ